MKRKLPTKKQKVAAVRKLYIAIERIMSASESLKREVKNLIKLGMR